MKRTLMMVVSLLLVARVASADVRIDPRPAKPSAVSQAPSTPHPVTEAPPAPPGVESRGWDARYAMAPEWVLALGVLGIGLWGLRPTSPRAVAV